MMTELTFYRQTLVNFHFSSVEATLQSRAANLQLNSKANLPLVAARLMIESNVERSPHFAVACATA
jgi:hypothetical protein